VPTKTTTLDTGGVWRLNDNTARAAQVAEIGAETAGAAATVQGNLNTHTGLTGTAVHGLGTASTLTSGATGAALVGAATVDAARSTLGMNPLALPPRQVEHATLTGWTAINVGTGSTTLVRNSFFQTRSGATANSSSRYTLLNSTPIGTNSSRGFQMTARFAFVLSLGVATANVEGIFRIFYGKASGEAFGMANSNNIGLTVENNQITNFFGVYGNTRNDVPITPVPITTVSGLTRVVFLYENKNISLFADGVLIGQNTGAGSAQNAFGSVNTEINNGASGGEYGIDFISYSIAF
jgi:hypothetical protein